MNLVVMNMSEEVEFDPGGFMPVNNDYDEQNTNAAGEYVPDNHQHHDGTSSAHRIVAYDNELRPAVLYASGPSSGVTGTWSISFPSKVKLWMWNADQSAWVDIPNGYYEVREMPVVRSFWVEGISHSTALRDVSIVGSVSGEGGGKTDTARLTIVAVDADVDSDNNDGFSDPGRTDAEEVIEDRPGEPGKIMPVNDGDVDGDGIPDFADGYNLLDKPGHDMLQGVSFVPYILDLRGVHFSADARIRFFYNASHPWLDTPNTQGGVVIDGDGTPESPFIYTAGPGVLRLWTRNADARTNSEPLRDDGYYVAPQVHYTLDDFTSRPSSPVALEPGVFRLWLEAVRPATSIGQFGIAVQVDPDGWESGGSFIPLTYDVVKVMGINMNLLLDSNRDGQITRDDNFGKATWEKGAGKRGALVLPNSDNDNGGNAPDNWAGGDWDLDGFDDPPNTVVDANGDIDDIAPLWAERLGPNALPDDMVIKLQVSVVIGEHTFFAGHPVTGDGRVDPENRVRIFLPTEVDGDNLRIKEGDEEIIGPTKGDTVEFVKTPAGAAQQSYDIFKGNGIIKFGIEGIEAGSMVDITMSVMIGAVEAIKDVVRILVSPFVLTDHRNPVAAGGAGSETVFVEHLGAANEELRAHLDDVYAAGAFEAFTGDRWHQDGYEIGYAQAPSYAQGAQPNETRSLPVVLELPRSEGPMQHWLRNSMLRADLAVITPFEGRGVAPHTQNSGGNIESLPRVGGGPGHFLHGNLMAIEQIEFFEGQAVNAAIELNTSWLLVGHVDEVVSLVPDGTGVMVADPELAWGLLLWANALDPAAPMLPGMVGVPAPRTVGAIVGDAAIRDFNMSWVMAPANLPSIRSTVSTLLGVNGPVAAPTADGANTGGATLGKGGAFVALFGNVNVRNYEIEFLDDVSYQLRYQEAGGPWSGWSAGRRDQDEVFAESRAFILEHWWSGIPVGGDRFAYTADPSANLMDMPVLFFEPDPIIHPEEASALTINFINSLVDGTTVITGKAHGPSVDWSGAGASDIFEAYTESAFGLAGFINVLRADGRVAYHNLQGFIHCGTNVIREIPPDDWWSF